MFLWMKINRGARHLPPPLFWFRIRKWDHSFVHDCVRLFLFVQLVLFFLSQDWWHAIPTFLILDSKMDSIVCISFVHDYIHLFSFVYLLLFFLPLRKGRGTCYPLFFWFWIWKSAQSFVFFYYIIVYVFFRLYTYYFSNFSWRGWGHAIPSFSDFGFENRLNRLYFVSTWLYTFFSFFVRTPLLSLSILHCISSIHV